jgi:polar amino acid transport system substrate-binding protein
VKKGLGATYNSAEAFNGKAVAAQNGTNQQIMVEEQLTGASLELITKIPDGVNMVKNGRVDALAVPKTVYDSVLAENDDLEVAEFAFDFEGGNYIASVKGEASLTAKIQELIDQINAEGLYQKWVDEILLAK